MMTYTLVLQESQEAAKGVSESFVQKVEKAYAKEDLTQVLDLFISQLNCVFEHTETEQGALMCHSRVVDESRESLDSNVFSRLPWCRFGRIYQYNVSYCAQNRVTC